MLLYSIAPGSYAGVRMLLVAAALGEELKTGIVLCRQKQQIPHRKISVWQAVRNEQKIVFLRTGVGPRRAAASLEEALQVISCSHILVIGYAGALDPGLKLGDVVAVARALAFSLDEDNHDWDHVRLDGAFNLTDSEALAQVAKAAGLNACIGDILTSPYVLGDPVHKRLLYDKFGASIVDMETAAMARVAAARSVPLSCYPRRERRCRRFLSGPVFIRSIRTPAHARQETGRHGNGEDLSELEEQHFRRAQEFGDISGEVFISRNFRIPARAFPSS